MKRVLAGTTIAVLFVLAIPAMGQQPPANPLEAKIAELEKRIAALESQITSIKNNQMAAQLARQSQPTTPPAPTPTTRPVAKVKANPADAYLVLEDFDYAFRQGMLNDIPFAPEDRHTITLSFRNTGTKEIKLIDATVRFTDLLDETLLSIKVPPDQNIVPGRLAVHKGYYSVGMFDQGGQARLRDMKKENIRATLKVRRLVFSDNTILQVEP